MWSDANFQSAAVRIGGVQLSIRPLTASFLQNKGQSHLIVNISTFTHRPPDVADVHWRWSWRVRVQSQDSRSASAADVEKPSIRQHHVFLLSLLVLQIFLRRIHRQETQACRRRKESSVREKKDIFQLRRFKFFYHGFGYFPQGGT